MNNNSETKSGGGMSRAAKKRAKKKQHQQEVVPVTQKQQEHSTKKREVVENNHDNNNDRKVSSKRFNNVNSSSSSSIMNKKRKNDDDNDDDDDDNDNNFNKSEDMVDAFDDDIAEEDEELQEERDESVAMKKDHASSHSKKGSNNIVSTTTNSLISILPDGCQSIIDILLLQNQSDSIMTEEKQQAYHEILQSMTAKERSQCMIEFILKPSSIPISTFYRKYWEKQPLLVSDNKNNHRKRFDGILSEKNIYKMIHQESLYYVRDIHLYQHEKHNNLIRTVNHDIVKDNDSSTIHNNNGSTSTTTNRMTNNEELDNIVINPDEQYMKVNSIDLWEKKYKNDGCIIQLLCPLRYNQTIHNLISLLELQWGCRVGIDATLKPIINNTKQCSSSPRYDSIEGFHLQIEGYQIWKVYEPIADNKLPRVSSNDDLQNNVVLNDMKPIIDTILGPGDMIYIPRGWIYTTCPYTNNDDIIIDHTLHITISAMQQWSWIDLFEILIPEAMSSVATSSTTSSLREGLPMNFLDYMGTIHDNYRDEILPESLRNIGTKSKMNDIKSSSNNENDDQDDVDEQEHQIMIIKQLQEKFRLEAKKRIIKITKEAMNIIDTSCDLMAIRFLSDRVPPSLSKHEIIDTIMDDENDHKDNESNHMNDNINDNNQSKKQKKKQKLILNKKEKKEILPDTLCRIVRPGIARLVIEEDDTTTTTTNNNKKAIVYHCLENSIVYHENNKLLEPLEFEIDDAPSIEQLLTTMEPYWISVYDLFHDTIEDKIGITQALYDEGILVLRN